MAKKSKIVGPHREMTKRQVSHWQTQKKRQRIIFISGIAIIAAIVLLIGGGWIISSYIPMHQTAISVNGRNFNMQYYIEYLKIVSRQNPQFASYYAETIARDIEQNELEAQAAASLGITVTNDEIKKKLKDNNLPNSEVYRDIIRAGLLEEKLKSDYFDAKVAKQASQRHILGMLLETENQTAAIRADLAKSDNFTSSFARIAGEQSLNAFSKSKKGDYGWHPQEIFNDIFTTKIPLDYAFSAPVGELSQPIRDDGATKSIGYWVIKVITKSADGEEADVLGMLLGSEAEANSVITRLKAGEDFATIAKERSQTGTAKDDGGKMGTIAKGTMSAAPDKFIFDAKTVAGTLSGAIRDDTTETKGGFWLIKVDAEQANRDLGTDDRDYLKSKALSAWVDSLFSNPNNYFDTSSLTDEKKAWAVQRASLR